MANRVPSADHDAVTDNAGRGVVGLIDVGPWQTGLVLSVEVNKQIDLRWFSSAPNAGLGSSR